MATDGKGWKNVVIIGASFAGHMLANTLAPKLPKNYRIVIIDQSEFALHAPAIVHAVAVPGAESHSLTAKVTQKTVFPAGSRHVVLCPVAVVELKKTSVVLDKEFEGSTELHFQHCILAMGASQPFPLRQAPGTEQAAYQQQLRDTQDGFKNANSILIIGGGAGGTEIAGELSAIYPGKKITLVHSRARLLVTGDQTETPKPSHDGIWCETTYAVIPDTLATAIQTQLEARGVKVVLSERVVFPTAPPANDTDWDGSDGALPGMRAVSLSSGRKLDIDCVLVSTGNKPNSQLVRAADPQALGPGGYVAINPNLRVVASSDASPMSGNYYAIGDVAATPGRKTASLAHTEGVALGKMLIPFIAAEARGKPIKEAKFTPRWLDGVLICLGVPRPNAEGVMPTGEAALAGAGAVTWPIFGTWGAPQWMMRWMAQDYFADRAFFARFTGEEKVSKEDG